MHLTLLNLLLKNWHVVVVAILAAGASNVITSVVYDGRIARMEKAHRADIKQAIDAQKDQFEQAKRILHETNQHFQGQLLANERELAAVKRLRPAKCVPVYLRAPASPGVTNQSSEGEYVVADAGISSHDLYDYGKSCKDLADQLTNAQHFVAEVWKANGQ